MQTVLVSENSIVHPPDKYVNDVPKTITFFLWNSSKVNLQEYVYVLRRIISGMLK